MGRPASEAAGHGQRPDGTTTGHPSTHGGRRVVRRVRRSLPHPHAVADVVAPQHDLRHAARAADHVRPVLPQQRRQPDALRIPLRQLPQESHRGRHVRQPEPHAQPQRPVLGFRADGAHGRMTLGWVAAERDDMKLPVKRDDMKLQSSGQA